MTYQELQMGEYRIYACAEQVEPARYAASVAINWAAAPGGCRTVHLAKQLEDGRVHAEAEQALAAALDAGLQWLEMNDAPVPAPSGWATLQSRPPQASLEASAPV